MSENIKIAKNTISLLNPETHENDLNIFGNYWKIDNRTLNIIEDISTKRSDEETYLNSQIERHERLKESNPSRIDYYNKKIAEAQTALNELSIFYNILNLSKNGLYMYNINEYTTLNNYSTIPGYSEATYDYNHILFYKKRSSDVSFDYMNASYNLDNIHLTDTKSDEYYKTVTLDSTQLLLENSIYGDNHKFRYINLNSILGRLYIENTSTNQGSTYTYIKATNGDDFVLYSQQADSSNMHLGCDNYFSYISNTNSTINIDLNRGFYMSSNNPNGTWLGYIQLYYDNIYISRTLTSIDRNNVLGFNFSSTTNNEIPCLYIEDNDMTTGYKKTNKIEISPKGIYSTLNNTASISYSEIKGFKLYDENTLLEDKYALKSDLENLDTLINTSGWTDYFHDRGINYSIGRYVNFKKVDYGLQFYLTNNETLPSGYDWKNENGATGIYIDAYSRVNYDDPRIYMYSNKNANPQYQTAMGIFPACIAGQATRTTENGKIWYSWHIGLEDKTYTTIGHGNYGIEFQANDHTINSNTDIFLDADASRLFYGSVRTDYEGTGYSYDEPETYSSIFYIDKSQIVMRSPIISIKIEDSNNVVTTEINNSKADFPSIYENGELLVNKYALKSELNSMAWSNSDMVIDGISHTLTKGNNSFTFENPNSSLELEGFNNDEIPQISFTNVYDTNKSESLSILPGGIYYDNDDNVIFDISVNGYNYDTGTTDIDINSNKTKLKYNNNSFEINNSTIEIISPNFTVSNNSIGIANSRLYGNNFDIASTGVASFTAIYENGSSLESKYVLRSELGNDSWTNIQKDLGEEEVPRYINFTKIDNDLKWYNTNTNSAEVNILSLGNNCTGLFIEGFKNKMNGSQITFGANSSIYPKTIYTKLNVLGLAGKGTIGTSTIRFNFGASDSNDGLNVGNPGIYYINTTPGSDAVLYYFGNSSADIKIGTLPSGSTTTYTTIFSMNKTSSSFTTPSFVINTNNWNITSDGIGKFNILQEKVNGVFTPLSEIYATKSEAGNIDLTDYLTKTEASETYVTKQELNDELDGIESILDELV